MWDSGKQLTVFVRMHVSGLIEILVSTDLGMIVRLR